MLSAMMKPSLQKSSHICLPSIVLEDLARLEVPFPWTFEVMSKSGSCLASVLEFTSANGVVDISSELAEALQIKEEARVFVFPKKLPRGTGVTLQPESYSFYDVPNHKEMLEAALKHYAVICRPMKITIETGDILHVMDTSPTGGVYCVDADLEVTFQPARQPARQPRPPTPLPEVVVSAPQILQKFSRSCKRGPAAFEPPFGMLFFGYDTQLRKKSTVTSKNDNVGRSH